MKRLVAALTVATFALSGCGVLSGGLRGVELPGGADLGDDPYQVTIEFPDVVDLVPQSLVKVADVSVGTVRSIDVDPQSWNARVTVAVNGAVALPADATARVRTTSLLGEKFVELAAPAQGATGSLRDSGQIPIERAGRAVEVEEVFGALSMLLNGGGVAQIKTISTELNAALTGREPQIRSLLDNLNTLVGALDDRKGEITRALDGINRLAATLNDRRPQIENALDNLEPGIAELERQRGQLVDMLQALDRLSGTATDTIDRSREDVLADLKALQPTLAKLAESGQDLPNSLQLIGSFPFTDAGKDAFAGDYANLYVRVDADAKNLLDNLIRGNTPLSPDLPILGQLPPTAQLLAPLVGGNGSGQPQIPLLGPVPTTTGQGRADPPSTVPRTATPVPPGPTDGSGDPGAPTGSGGRGGLLGGLLGGGR
ncbi:MCE family protein [Pseudonocardia oroxyli]|uniref:Phospholipid/cholesterol/gamma-HCH transport system substrate-binding protein n=1 Tax=Pseudonocardia oroxyli TaxID=366584 RepID=A0A1G7GFD7_PSEOR|nr:MCE family protein [Pseudonocardia oroxyli]SDE86836.1 phospholipid/cholesterol/gamma-HCH transport system substrate-binding protein [Pseudonocardia oroxyli]